MITAKILSWVDEGGLQPEVATSLKGILAPLLEEGLRGTAGSSTARYTLFQNALSKRYGVVSLVEVPDSTIMWSLYANKHAGFVLGFDATAPPFNDPPPETIVIGRTHRVTYTSSRPLFLGTTGVAADEAEALGTFFLTKALVWSFEREWRLVHNLERFATLDGGHHYLHAPMGALKEVVFGWRTPVDTRQAVIEALGEAGVANSVRLYQTWLSADEFELEVLETDAAEALKPLDMQQVYEHSIKPDVNDLVERSGMVDHARKLIRAQAAAMEDSNHGEGQEGKPGAKEGKGGSATEQMG